MENGKAVKKPAGIRIKLIALVAAFTAVLLIVIWMLFVVFLDGFYKYTKARELESTARVLEAAIYSGNYEETALALSRLTDSSILIFRTGEDGIHILSQNANPGSMLTNSAAVMSLLVRTQQDGGEGTYTVDEPKDPDFSPVTGRSKDAYMLRSKIMHDSHGGVICMMISVTLNPVDATTNTIRNMLVVVSVMFIIMAVIMAYFFAKNISDPLSKISKSARDVGTDKYCPVEGEMPYKEAAELNDTLQRTHEELSRVDELRKELIANVSHDLRTPLTMISGYGEVMRDIPGENSPENVQIIIDEAEHLKRLVEDMLSISKLESGMEHLDLAEFSITDMLIDMVSRYSAMKAMSGYTVNFEYDRNIRVLADEVKISQVFSNLLNNAINYTGEDKTVTVKQTEYTKKGIKYVKFDVIDTGDGIQPENMPHIWDRYYKENRTHKRAMVGTGLGLSIVKKITELHKGEYGVISRPGEGADFWFAIECCPSDQKGSNESHDAVQFRGLADLDP